ncbi:MAG: zinc metalloproteinase precursor [uncultured bacterium]|nr:MAG: zinc metalloproteinase precursor [uncultured bacterium]
MSNKLFRLAVAPVLLGACYSAFAAKPVDLNTQDISVLKPFISVPSLKASADGSISADKLVEKKRNTDFNQTLHIRVQQTHAGYPVFGADAIVHIPNADRSKASLMNLVAVPNKANITMDGTIYQDLASDLANTPAVVFSKEQAQKVLGYALALAEKKFGRTDAEDKQNQLMVYVDQNNKAHWAFRTTFYFKSTTKSSPQAPVYIIDAMRFNVYKEWNDVQSLDSTYAGGLGGNYKGKLIYDGLKGNLDKFAIERDAAKKTCYLRNIDAEVRDARNNENVVNFRCDTTSYEHNNVFWDASLDQVNGGYSPSNDALYNGSVVKELYKQWYQREMLVNNDGSPMKLVLITHQPDDNGNGWENAVWDGKNSQIYLGDGAETFYPLTSLDVIAHEVSHGFTKQHSNLIYESQSGGMNESFSDMAAQAAESFALSKPTWMIGSEITKNGGALRYMDHPSKDCAGGVRGNCSIDNVYNYTERLNVHNTSGIYNRAFYVLANSSGWNVKKAFAVMVKANSDYWMPSVTFKKGACGVLKATFDYQRKTSKAEYNEEAVVKAFEDVGIVGLDTCMLDVKKA